MFWKKEKDHNYKDNIKPILDIIKTKNIKGLVEFQQQIGDWEIPDEIKEYIPESYTRDGQLWSGVNAPKGVKIIISIIMGFCFFLIVHRQKMNYHHINNCEMNIKESNEYIKNNLKEFDMLYINNYIDESLKYIKENKYLESN